MITTGNKTRENYPLSPRKPLKKTVASLWGWLILFVLVEGVYLFISFVTKQSETPIELPISFGVVFTGMSLFLLVIGLLTYLYQYWYYIVYFYNLDEDFITIRKGVITPAEITIPYERVQDVYMDQDLFDRIFGLYDVHLSSATVTSGIEAHIDGLEKQPAAALRDLLMKTISAKIQRGKTGTAS